MGDEKDKFGRSGKDEEEGPEVEGHAMTTEREEDDPAKFGKYGKSSGARAPEDPETSRP